MTSRGTDWCECMSLCVRTSHREEEKTNKPQKVTKRLTRTPISAPFLPVSRATVSGRWRRANRARARSTHQWHIKAFLSACFHSTLSSQLCHSSEKDHRGPPCRDRPSPTHFPCLLLIPFPPLSVTHTGEGVSLTFTRRHHLAPLASGLISPPPHLGCVLGSEPLHLSAFPPPPHRSPPPPPRNHPISAQTVAASMQNGLWQFLGHQHFWRG